MEFFLGAELYADAGWRWAEVRDIVEPELNKLSTEDYGDDLLSIGIISLIFPEDHFEDGSWKEMSLYSKKEKDADVRLKINYKQFCRSKKKDRLDIYIEHIIESIKTLENKVGKDFDFLRLMTDMKTVLNNCRLEL